jgi:uncharacterized membrane protein YedE/YeeE
MRGMDIVKKPRDRIFYWAMLGAVVGALVGYLSLAVVMLHWKGLPGPNIGWGGLVGMVAGILVGVRRHQRAVDSQQREYPGDTGPIASD